MVSWGWVIILSVFCTIAGIILGGSVVFRICDETEPPAGDLYLADDKEVYADLDENVLKRAKNRDIVRLKIRIINTSYSGDKNPRKRGK